MAISLLRLPLRLFTKNGAIMNRNTILKTPNITEAIQIRTGISVPCGEIIPTPKKISFGLLRMTIVVVPFLYLGNLISKHFAAVVEEHDISVPEDDDDDD